MPEIVDSAIKSAYIYMLEDHVDLLMHVNNHCTELLFKKQS